MRLPRLLAKPSLLGRHARRSMHDEFYRLFEISLKVDRYETRVLDRIVVLNKVKPGQ